MLALIVGLPGTGTSWAWELLTAHPDAKVLMPADVFPERHRLTAMETALFMDKHRPKAAGPCPTDDEIREVLARTMGDHVLIEKTPRHIEFLERAWGFVPDAKVIMMTRAMPDTLACLGRKWPGKQGQAKRLLAGLLPWQVRRLADPRVLVVGYECMIEDLPRELGRMCDHVGLSREGIEQITAKDRDTYMSDWRRKTAC